MTKLPLVSIIIPCYNQGRYLGDAIESVLRQSYRRLEIIVVDDGSTDDSSQVARKYSDVKLIRQENRGLSRARNAGLEASRGDYLVFLDADDRLLPGAIQAGANCLDYRPDCAFVYGRYRLIKPDGVPMSSSQGRCPKEEPFLDMLRSNYIGMHATVMYRRTVFDSVEWFDASITACEDYDLYLRITRNFPIYCYGKLVAEYRQHNSNMSCDAGLMLKTSLCVLGSQRKFIRGNRQAQEAYRAGMRNWQEYYGKKLLKVVRSGAEAREWKKVLKGLYTLLRYYPRGVANKAGKKIKEIRSEEHTSELQSPQ